MTNEFIRTMAINYDVKLWKIADCIGVTDSTFSRLLRKQFLADEEFVLAKAIEMLAEAKSKGEFLTYEEKTELRKEWRKTNQRRARHGRL